jgi:aerobic carbon-monoxide dehydrogenase large subunit
MNDMSPNRAEREAKLEGMGCKRKRVEDIRFTQGKGNYVDDMKLPGMLFGDFVRSPYAHARVKKIDTKKALKVPGVLAVLTAVELKGVNLAWMPTLAGDVQMVLADGKVLFQNQEVAFVVATDRYAAADGVEAVEVDYEALPVLVDPFKAMAKDAPVLREDLKGKTSGAHGPRKHHNHVFEWSVGDKAATDAAFEKADVTIKELLSYHRTHPSPLETCQCVASFDKIKGELTVWGTFQAPHVIRTVASLISTIPEHKIHVISPDIGGGFGNKVGAYPGYICAIVASIVTGKPVKWVEDRIENLTTTSFARDYHMTTEIAATRDGKVEALRVHVLADHGAFDACANPSKFPAGFFSIVTGSYDFPVAHTVVDTVYTNKAPGGVAYRCSLRVTEASYAIERGMDILAQKLGMDPVELRLKNFIKREQFPYQSALGWEYDSGDYHTAMNKVTEAVGYKELRAEQAAKRLAFKRGETRDIMGLGVAFFTEIVGAGPSKNCDILGLAMFDSCEIRVHPTGSATARMGSKSQGQGHETTYAQIIASEIGIPADSIMIEEGNTDTAPYGIGTFGSRSTPVAGAAIAMASRKIRNKAQMIAAYLLEVHEGDLEWDIDGFRVKGLPEKTKSMKELVWAAYNSPPPGMEPGLEAVSYYDPPNMTYPFGAYFCVMDIDVDTGVYKVRRFYALDDCGTRINPMIIEGQVHGGLTEAFAIAMGQEIRYDEIGNVLTGSFMDFFMPTAVETPHWETDHTVTPSPHHPIGAKGVGESPNVGGVPAFSNAVNDAFSFLGSTHIQMPHDYWRNWEAAKRRGVVG